MIKTRIMTMEYLGDGEDYGQDMGRVFTDKEIDDAFIYLRKQVDEHYNNPDRVEFKITIKIDKDGEEEKD